MRKLPRSLLLPLLLLLTAASPAEIQRWRDQAQRVIISRDDWGIAHVHGSTDADAVFGMIYAQAEDDFPRIEANYLTALGRTAEADGEAAIWQDLRARLYVSDAELKAQYTRSPDWLKRLMDGWAAGLNFFLATHPQVKPRVLTRFEPWMALSFTEGSIGGDIERIDLAKLERFYSRRRPKVGSGSGAEPAPTAQEMPKRVQYDGVENEFAGSNGIAIAPAITRDGKALLLINPHTSFFFRSEQHVTSDAGLDVYGAATWGQFFIYQGFNRHAGWMHTSSGVDNVDEFAEFVDGIGKARCYRYGRSCLPLARRAVTIRYRNEAGRMATRSFATWRTHHGPIVRSDNGRWIAFAMMHRPVEALQQSFLRTRATDLESFLRIAQLRANSSNNTIFASSKGEIAYLHPQFVPRRDDRFDYTGPVDGSDPQADWGSLHQLSELPSAINPPTGWVQNTNTWPYRASGPYSPKPENFPKYMDMFGENYRGIHILSLLTGSRDWSLDRLQAAAFDTFQPAFAELVPGLVAAWDSTGDQRLKAKLAEPVAALRAWDHRWSVQSVPTTLATFWATPLWDEVRVPKSLPHQPTVERIQALSPQRKLAALESAVDRLQAGFGSWRTPWGEVNRFQRISPAIDHPFSDDAVSIPVGFTSGRWGSLASFESGPKDGSKRWYGTSGNSFVAVVEFGSRVRARAVTAGGESSDPSSPHFNDQAPRYASGALREVYVTADDLKGHVKRRYKPGE